tara:strand:- start:9853 stop:10602 length:750 start_codon:yes stop_codon:yes gene_type:complete
MEKILKNKKILISGIGKGLGLDMFYKCIDSGAFIYGFTRSKDDIKKIKKEYLKKSKIFVGNASDYKFLKKLFFYFKKNKIYLNGLINNAGQRQRKSFVDITKKDINDIINVNFLSVFLISQFFVKNAKKTNQDSIVNIGSIVGEKPFSDLIGYASSKSAISGFTKSLALELAEKNYNIRVNCINPGFTKTSYFQNFKKNKKLYKWTLSKISAGRWGESSEISKLAIFLLSNKASYINGQIINIDGGWKY